MNHSRQRTRMTSHRHTGRRGPDSPLLSILFFPAAIFYHELLLRLFDRDTAFFSMALPRAALFSLAAGLCLFLILDLLPWRKAARIAGSVLTGVWTVLLCVERGCRATFGVYYGLAFMSAMAADVTGEFGGTVASVALGLIPFILLSLVPLGLYILLRRAVIREDGQEPGIRIILAVGLVVCQLLGWALSAFGGAASYYTYDYTANVSIPHFGLVTTVRLDLKYAVAGTPLPPLDGFIDEPLDTTAPTDTGEQPTADPVSGPTDGPDQRPVPSGPNALDIDFEALAEAETDETVQGMHQYFASLTPSEKNEYTGMFEGKNLILLTAEAFSPYAIDKELTPTLYKLTHEGFVFNNFYQPDWTMSTTGGEFSVTTGLIPNWYNGGKDGAPRVSVTKSMPLTLAHLFAAEGYSVPAWHDHTYTYYGRDEYLGNFGYDYKGIGNGLEMADSVSKKLWPESDLEMMQETVDGYIDGYVNNGQLFHAYYMTVSGHGKYSWSGNDMSAKHRAEVEAKYPGLSEVSQAYLACNMELDLAMEYLVDKLEAAGIADDTLIVMAADHYPYLMVMDHNGPDYYNEIRGFEDTESDTSRYRNTLLMWSGCIKEPIVVDTPCSAIDIVPTVCNLFGLEYDSRLYSGRDIFAANYEADKYSNCMPLVVFANKGQGNSWITAAGTYECSTKTFIPNEGVTLEDQEDYVARVKRLVNARINYSKLILEVDYYGILFPDGIG